MKNLVIDCHHRTRSLCSFVLVERAFFRREFARSAYAHMLTALKKCLDSLASKSLLIGVNEVLTISVASFAARRTVTQSSSLAPRLMSTTIADLNVDLFAALIREDNLSNDACSGCSCCIIYRCDDLTFFTICQRKHTLAGAFWGENKILSNLASYRR